MMRIYIPIFIPIAYKPKLNLYQPKLIYYRFPKKEYITEIIEPPEDIAPILEYAMILKEDYGKEVKLTLIKTKSSQSYLRFQREDGIPLYIRLSDRELFILKRDIANPITPIAIGYFIRSCGYKAKYHSKRELIAKLLPACKIRYVKEP